MIHAPMGGHIAELLLSRSLQAWESWVGIGIGIGVVVCTERLLGVGLDVPSSYIHCYNNASKIAVYTSLIVLHVA